MQTRYGKRLDSYRLKIDLDKSKSVSAAREASLAITPGPEISRCPLCDSSANVELQTIYGFTYRQCGGCDGVYVSNPPAQSDLESLYSSEYYTNSNKILLANDNVVDFRMNQVARPKVEHVIENIVTEKRSWLDIGCGIGETLAVAAEHDFRCVGVETNAMERSYAQKKFGIDVRDEFIDRTTVGKYRGEWGVISLISVLEHLRDPPSILESIADIQDKDDALVIEVPHFPCIGAYSQMTFPDHVNRLMHPPIHLYLFSREALGTLLGRFGYEITHAWYFGQDFYEILSTISLLVDRLNDSTLLEHLGPLISEVQEVFDRHELCDSLFVIARKQ